MPNPDRLVIVTPCWNRPRYLKRALASLAACQGIGDCLLLPHVEPGCAETRDLIERFDACETHPTWNAERQGCTANTVAAWLHGFDRSDFVILVEEDILLAPDALGYYRWARNRYRDSPEVGSVTAYHRRDTAAPADESHVARRRLWFHGWSSAMWSDRFLPHVESMLAAPFWDSRLHDLHLAGGQVEVYPELARCQNIGITTSIHTGENAVATHFAQLHRLRHWAGPVEVAAGTWVEVE